MLKIENVSGGYYKKAIIHDIRLEVQKGDFFALLGPNGSGKTTLFKLITGQLPISKGKVLLSGKPISSYSKIERAKKIAVLTQEADVSFDYTVEEIVSLGRYPHQKGMLKTLSKKDMEIIEEVMELTKVSQYRYTQFRKISGGEKQRVLLAKALAQEPELLLLDEPTNHLDIKHTFQILDLLKERQQSKELTIFAILHDLNVASLYANRFALLNHGTLLEVGDVELLKEEEILRKVYQVQVNVQSHPTVPKPQLLMTPHYGVKEENITFEDFFEVRKDRDVLHVHCKKPLRTISNGMLGDGIQWLRHFCCFSIEDQRRDSSQEDLKNLMNLHSIPQEETVGMITTGELGDVHVIREKIENVKIALISTINRHHEQISGLNLMLFIDGKLTDGALVNSLIAAQEAKLRALQELGCGDSVRREALYIAVTQQGETITNGRSKAIEAIIRSMIAQAVKKAVQNQ